jgi:hypothetical protein
VCECEPITLSPKITPPHPPPPPPLLTNAELRQQEASYHPPQSQVSPHESG